MRKDIIAPKVEGVAMAIVREPDEDGEEAWYAYLINLTDQKLDTVLVSSKGYGEVAGETRKTSELRHMLDHLDPKNWARIERLVEDVFALSNQYWLSYYVDGVIYDKKYIFLAGSIEEVNFTTIPLMDKRGILIG